MQSHTAVKELAHCSLACDEVVQVRNGECRKESVF